MQVHTSQRALTGLSWNYAPGIIVLFRTKVWLKIHRDAGSRGMLSAPLTQFCPFLWINSLSQVRELAQYGCSHHPFLPSWAQMARPVMGWQLKFSVIHWQANNSFFSIKIHKTISLYCSIIKFEDNWTFKHLAQFSNHDEVHACLLMPCPVDAGKLEPKATERTYSRANHFYS